MVHGCLAVRLGGSVCVGIRSSFHSVRFGSCYAVHINALSNI